MAFPNTPVLDNFNRADGALGANWTQSAFLAGGLNVSLNTCASPSTSNGMLYTAGGTPGRPFELYTTVPTVGGTDYGLDYFVQANSSPESLFRLQVHGGTALNIYRAAAGGYTQIFTVAKTPANGDAFGVSVDVAGVHTVWYKLAAGGWVSQGTVTDTTYTSGLFGIFIGNATVRFDDFGGGNVPTGSTPRLSLLGVG